MSVKGIISCCKYQLYRMRLIPVFFVAWVFGILLFGAVTASVVTKTPFTLRGASMGGMDVLLGLFIFIFMCVYISDFINTAAANGVSRTTACISSFITSVIFSFVSALEVSVIYPIVSLLTGEAEEWGAAVYGEGAVLLEAGFGIAHIRLRFFFVCLFTYIAICAAAMLMTAIYYKLPQWLAIAVIFALILLPTAGTAMLFGTEFFTDMMLRAMAAAGFAGVNGSALGNVFQGAAVFIGSSVILLAVSCLITFRSSVKPLPVKGE